MPKKTKFSRPMTAEELMERLESDPEWVAQRDARERWRQKQSERILREEQPLVREIAEAGLLIESVWDLVNTREPYPEAIPILLRHLQRTDYDPAIRNGIARALTVKGHPEILPAMIEAFRRDPDPSSGGPKAAMGNAIEVLLDEGYIEEIADLARDPAHGEARGMLAYALVKSKSPVAEKALQELLSDPQMKKYVEEALKRRDRRRRKHKPGSS